MKGVYSVLLIKLQSTNHMMKDSIVVEETSSSTAYGGGGGSRAIDRHNPIIRDEKRVGRGRIFPSNSTITISSATTTDHHHHQNLTLAAEGGDQKKKSIVFADTDDGNGDGGGGGFVSPASSSRCLLGDKATINFLSEFHHVLPPPPHPPPSPPLEPLKFKNGKSFTKKKDDEFPSFPPTPPPLSPPRFLIDNDDSPSSSPPKPPPLPPPEPLKFNNSKASNNKHHDPPSSATPKPSSPTASSDKVVGLEVSLHCRGCERKMKKHISKIEGVTSFKIEFAAKKVTVVGDVTPLAVLTSVLKVKNAKILTPATISSSSSSSSSSQVGSIPNQLSTS